MFRTTCIFNICDIVPAAVSIPRRAFRLLNLDIHVTSIVTPHDVGGLWMSSTLYKRVDNDKIQDIVTAEVRLI